MSRTTPKIWNELPMYIRNLHNFSIFKKLVKTYYFEEAFNVNTSCNILIYIILFIFLVSNHSA